MKLDEIDKNLLNKGLRHEDYTWYPLSALTLCGCLDPEPPMHRFSRKLAASLSERSLYLSGHSAGIRVRFYTDSPYIAVSAALTQTAAEAAIADMTIVNASGFDMYEKEAGIPGAEYRFKGIFRPDGLSDSVCCDVERYRDEFSLIEINFPLFNGVRSFAVGIKSGCRLEADTEKRKRFVLYGSSITQGGCSSRPGNSYGAYLSRLLDADYVNIGLSGNCLGQDEMARYIAGIDMDAFVFDYDHNSPNAEYLEKTHGRFFEIFRKAQPETPVIMLTMPLFDKRIISGYGWWEQKRTQIIYDTYQKALRAGDKNVYFIDGDSLISCKDRDFCTHDHVHCNDMGFYLFAGNVLPVLKKALYG